MGMPIIIQSTATFDQAVTDIIESVALEQAALSHILNAEGEKLQKVIAMSADAHDLLCVNKSVARMVSTITRLEVVLEAKLELFSDYYSNDCELISD